MSVARKIINLIAGIDDPAIRMDIATTINYLFSIFSDGLAKEDQIRDALYEVFIDVLTSTKPELTDEEIKKKSRILVDDFMTAFKLESLHRRLSRRIRLPPPV